MVMDLNWVDYLHEAPAGDRAVEQLESELGVRFPEDFRHTLVQRQGMYPEPGMLQASFRTAKRFGPLLLAQAHEGRHAPYTIASVARALHEDHPKAIIPFAMSGNAWFAYDFGADRERPPIVFINPDEPGDSPRARVTVAQDLTALLEQLRPE